jgi:hypothetical protein
MGQRARARAEGRGRKSAAAEGNAKKDGLSDLLSGSLPARTRRPPMPVRKLNTVTERASVNYIRGVVEADNSVFKEQDLRHDYGHDAFVLLVEGEKVLPKEIAMQIKSGASYCTPTTSKIPATGGQLMFWAGHDMDTLGPRHRPRRRSPHLDGTPTRIALLAGRTYRNPVMSTGVRSWTWCRRP